MIDEAIIESEEGEAEAAIEDPYDEDRMVVYAAKDEPVLFSTNGSDGSFDDAMFGTNDDPVVVSVFSLFEGVYPVGTLLRMDFTPFYKSRIRLLLTRSNVVWDKNWNQNVFKSEKVLTRINDRWYVGGLAERHYQPIIDFIGPWLNSYTRVEEIGSEDMQSTQNSYDCETLAILRKVQAQLLENPSLGEKFYVWFDSLAEAQWRETGKDGLTTEAIFSWCNGTRSPLLDDDCITKATD